MTQHSIVLGITFLVGLGTVFVLLRPAMRKILPTVAMLIAALASVAGVVYFASRRSHAEMVSTGFLHSTPEALWFAVTVGVCIAAFVLLLGYIYGDAKRRQMPAAAWVIAALFIPNLIGFILYFLFRRPLLDPCRQCGKPVRAGEAFCSHCGSSQHAVTVNA